ncbi:hypothetical protein BHE74_00037994 [Ensete ventricosum]|nr:hypothetical protein GW17_00051893 [Ensete ventricosum]RWW55379.1 hypothetical protein BHE74_00037994 [Ensete ventricosum]RZS13885.1 hypothetical protein BHM03_00045523 [Ensete ventricosum]
MEIKILKEQEEGIQTSTIYRALTATMPSISILALLDRGEVLKIGADITGVEIGTTLLQVGRPLIRTKAHPTLQTRLLIYKGILIATEVWHDTTQQHEGEVKMGPRKSWLLPTSDSNRAHTTRDLIRGQPSFQKKARLLLKNDHVETRARKKHPPDKRQSKRKFVVEDQVSLHLQPHQLETRASRKWSPYYFGPCKFGDHIGVVT